VPRLQAAEREFKQKTEQYVADFRAQASRELSEARADQSVVSATKVALEDRLDRTLVRAPVGGTIKQVKVNTVGGVVQPGMDLVEIVPIDDTLLVEARIRPQDIAFLRPGLPAMVKLSAYDFSIYGGIEGTVERISADAIVDDRPGSRAESFYLVRVRTQHASHGAGDRNLKIIPGMQATVDLRTEFPAQGRTHRHRVARLRTAERQVGIADAGLFGVVERLEPEWNPFVGRAEQQTALTGDLALHHASRCNADGVQLDLDVALAELIGYRADEGRRGRVIDGLVTLHARLRRRMQ
jgi:hypothetical protein